MAVKSHLRARQEGDHEQQQRVCTERHGSKRGRLQKKTQKEDLEIFFSSFEVGSQCPQSAPPTIRGRGRWPAPPPPPRSRHLISPSPTRAKTDRRCEEMLDPLSVEAILRIGAFGCFLGHGWIAAWKLEYGPWSKFTAAAGFRDSEAQVIMPLIGWMDLILAVVTLLRPMELLSAWMVVWAFSTALVRPVSAGLARAMRPMSDNATWGFVERASNWGCPLALLALQKAPGYKPAELVPGLGAQLAPLDQYLNVPGATFREMLVFMGWAFIGVWSLVPLLKSRGPVDDQAQGRR
jgi:hypothetical protein